MPDRAECANPFVAAAQGQRAPHQRHRLVAVRHPHGVGAKALVVHHFRQASDLAEGTPQRIVGDAEDQGLVGGVEDFVGAQRFVAGTRPLRLGAPLPEALQEIAEKAGGGIEQRRLDGRADAGAGAFVQGREYADQRMQAGRLVDRRERAAHRRAVALAGDASMPQKACRITS